MKHIGQRCSPFVMASAHKTPSPCRYELHRAAVFLLRDVLQTRIICFTLYGCSCFFISNAVPLWRIKTAFFWIIGKTRWKCRLAGCFVLYRPKNRAGQTGEKGADKAIYRTAYRTGSASFELFSGGWVKMSYFPFITQNMSARKWKPAPHRRTPTAVPNVNIRYLFAFQKFPFLFPPPMRPHSFAPRVRLRALSAPSVSSAPVREVFLQQYKNNTKIVLTLGLYYDRIKT